MHSLLARQLKKAASPDGQIDLARFTEMVGLAYEEADKDRRLKDHAFAEMQTELEGLNGRIKDESEARFSVVMDNVGEAVVIINAEGRIEGFNKAAERIFGYTAAEVQGRNVNLLMSDVDAAHHDRTLANYLRTGLARIIGVGRETLARRKDGVLFPIELAVGEVEGGPGRQFIGVIRDITLRKQAESELRESESRFRDLVGSASDWYWETDRDYRLTFISERIGSVLGAKPSALLGLTWFDIGLDEQSDLAARHRADLAAAAPFRDLVFSVGPEGAKDGKIIRISGIPRQTEEGTVIGYRGVGADITREAVAERRAVAAQQQLVDAIESIVDAIAVYDADTRLVIFNGAYAAMIDGGRELLRPGMSYEEVLTAAYNQHLVDVGEGGFDRWLAASLARLKNADGKPFIYGRTDGRWFQNRECRTREGGVVVVRTDITRLKHREAELDRLRRRYEIILDSAGEGIVGLDAEGRITFANRVAGSILGREPDGMAGQGFHSLITAPGASLQAVPAVVAAYRSGTAGLVTDVVFRPEHGPGLAVDFFVAPIVEGGGLTGAVLVFRDATLRLQYERAKEDQQRELARLVAERTAELRKEVDVRARTETALRSSRERLKAITDSLFEGVVVVDREGQLVFANQSAKQLLGWGEAAGDLEGHPIAALLSIRANHQGGEQPASPWQRVCVEGITLRDDDAQFVTASGEVLSVAYACSPVGEDEARRTAIISFRDIEALKQAQRDALQSSRLATVGQLAAGIAHEINTPIQYIGDNLHFIERSLVKLTSVLDAGRALADEAAGQPDCAAAAGRFQTAAAAAKLPFLLEETPVAVAESLDGVAQIARIVLSMKEFSHPGTSTKTTTDINRSLESTLTVSHNVWKVAAEVVKDFDPALPSVMCHAGEMNQVFLNLVVNAAQAIEASGKPLPGRITVSTSAADGFVAIRVADTGTGVPLDLRDKIFDPFFTTKDVGKGTGQGLAICRDVVVTKHGGTLTVDGVEGEGAVFTVRLPIERAGREEKDSD